MQNEFKVRINLKNRNMRNKERLPILWRFMKTPRNVLKYFIQIVKLHPENAKKMTKNFLEVYSEMKQYHEENPDLRLSQVIQNCLFYLPGFWYYKEDNQVLIELGLEPRKVLLWGQNYDKDMKRLRKTKWKPICKLSTEHIEVILKTNSTTNKLYLKAFNEELEWRKNLK